MGATIDSLIRDFSWAVTGALQEYAAVRSGVPCPASVHASLRNELFKWCAPAPLGCSGARVGRHVRAPEKAGTVTD